MTTRLRSAIGILTTGAVVALLGGCGSSPAAPPTAQPSAGVPSAVLTTPPTTSVSQATEQPTSGEPTATSAVATEAATTPTTLMSASPTTGAAGTLQKVRFALDWTPNTNHTGIYVAIARGWYKEQGLDVQLLPYSDANTPDTLVATGQADFGISFEESVVTDQISKLPIKSVAAVLQTNTSALATLKSSGLDRPAKLVGKRYAGFGSPYEEPVVATVMKADGATSTDFKNITTNLAGYQSLVAKQTDFVWIYLGWEGIQAKLDNVALYTFPIKDYKVPDYYTPVIIGNTDFLSKQGDVARRFLAATARGYEYGASNPADAAGLLIKTAPAGTFPDPRLPQESQAYLAQYYLWKQPHWGVQTLDYWTNYPRFIASTGLLKTADGNVVKPEDLDYAGLFTNDYLPQK